MAPHTQVSKAFVRFLPVVHIPSKANLDIISSIHLTVFEPIVSDMVNVVLMPRH
jgi:hypothetical protein